MVISFLYNSICCGVLVLVLLILQKIFKNRVSHSVFYVISLLNMILFSIPISLFLPKKHTILPTENKPIISQINIEKHITNVEKAVSKTNALDIITAIWLCITAIIIIALLIRHFTIVRKITRWKIPSQIPQNKHFENRIFICPMLTTAVTLGFLRPIILLPENADFKEIPYILDHEKIHVKRHDPLIKLVSAIITSFNWFNPCAWILFKIISAECELSCDELATKNYSKSKRFEYANLLINQMKNQNLIFNSFVSEFSKNAKILQERLDVIMDGKKKKIAVSLLVVGVTAAAFCAYVSAAEFAKKQENLSPENVIEKYVNNPEKYQNLAVYPYFNPEFIEKTEFISIEPADGISPELPLEHYTGSFSEVKIFSVKYNIDYKTDFEKMMTEPDGEKEKFFTVINTENGWMIDSIGY